jgi:hypothetical protein
MNKALKEALREHLRKVGAKGGRSRSPEKLRAVRANLRRANAAKRRMS